MFKLFYNYILFFENAIKCGFKRERDASYDDVFCGEVFVFFLFCDIFDDCFRPFVLTDILLVFHMLLAFSEMHRSPRACYHFYQDAASELACGMPS